MSVTKACKLVACCKKKYTSGSDFQTLFHGSAALCTLYLLCGESISPRFLHDITTYVAIFHFFFNFFDLLFCLFIFFLLRKLYIAKPLVDFMGCRFR